MIHVFINEFYKTTQKIIIKIKIKPPLWFTRAVRFRGGRRVGPRGNMRGRDATQYTPPLRRPGVKTAAGVSDFLANLFSRHDNNIYIHTYSLHAYNMRRGLRTIVGRPRRERCLSLYNDLPRKETYYYI